MNQKDSNILCQLLKSISNNLLGAGGRLCSLSNQKTAVINGLFMCCVCNTHIKPPSPPNLIPCVSAGMGHGRQRSKQRFVRDLIKGKIAEDRVGRFINQRCFFFPPNWGRNTTLSFLSSNNIKSESF